MGTRERQSLAERWQAFGKLDHLTEHWYWRPGWRIGRSFYTWHLTFDGAAELHELVTRLHAALSTPALDPVPLSGLHLTMQGIGFTDEVDDADLAAIVDAVRTQLGRVAAFDLTLGPVDADAEGTGLLIDPWEPVERVRLAVRAGIAQVWGEDGVPEPAEGFRPHVTIAYSASDAPAGPVRDLLVGWRETPPVTARVDQVQLIRLNRDEREYRWDVVASVPLAGG